MKLPSPTNRLTDFRSDLARVAHEWQVRKADELLRHCRDDDLEHVLTSLRACLVRAISVAVDALPEAVALGAKRSGRDGRPRQLLRRAAARSATRSGRSAMISDVSKAPA